MKRIWWFVLGTVLSGFVAAALPSAVRAGPEGSVICGTIDVDTRWTVSGSPYLVTCSSEVAPGAVLTIDPGVVVQFDGSDLVMYGSLQAVGTAALHITFTSAEAIPSPGDWGHLKFSGDDQSSLLQYVVVEYGGLYWGNQIALEAGALAIHDSVVRFGLGAGLEAWTTPTLTGTAFEHNGAAPIRLLFRAGAKHPGEISGNQGSGNGVNGIYLVGTFDADVALGANTGMAYYTAHETLMVAAGHTLTLLPGAVLKMDDTRVLVSGSLRAEGTSAHPVVFTSLRDDTYEGDTNGDGGASQPAPGDWGDLTVDSDEGGWTPPYPSYIPLFIHQRGGAGSLRSTPRPIAAVPVATEGSGDLPASFAGLYMDHAIVRYGGQDMAGISVFESPVTILNSTIERSAARGIYVEDTSPEIRSSIIRNNTTMGLWIYGLDVPVGPVLVDNSFTENGTYAAYLLFWGDCHPATEIHGNSGWGNGKVNGLYLEGYIDSPTGCRLQPNPQFPYVVWAIEVYENGRLKLEPGTELKFVAPELDRGTGTLIISGTLEALGTADAPVAFTSFWDDQIGGDTDGTAEPPLPGDWLGIIAGGGAHVVLDHALLRYGGPAGANLWAVDAQLAMTNSEISDSATKGLAVGFTQVSLPLLVHDNEFLGNEEYAVSLVSVVPSLDGSSFASNGGSGNGVDGLQIDAVLGTASLEANPALPYVIQSLAVASGKTVVVGPGVVFKSDTASGGGGLLAVDGMLQILGTAATPVYFTSLHDDAVGGDTDNASIDPSPGDWYGIYVPAGGQADLQWATIRYGGRGGSSLDVDGALHLADSTVAYSLGKGLQVVQEIVLEPVMVEDSTFADNGGVAATLRSEGPYLGNWEFVGNHASGNAINGILLDGVLSSLTLKENPTLPYVIQSLAVAESKTVIVNPGVVFKADTEFSGGGGLLTVSGVLQAMGTANRPVYFTSLHDDTVGGDTDNASIAPAPGDWYGVSVSGSGQAVLSHSANRYAGLGGSALSFTGSNLSVTDSAFAYSADKGLAVRMGGFASVTVTNCTFEENEGYAVSTSSVDPTLSGVNFSGNGGSGNGLNAIFLDGTLGTVVIKPNTELPYAFQSLAVGAGQIATVEAGVVFKATRQDPGSLGLFSVFGSLQVIGSTASPVHFTSIHDDSVGGDTDGTSTPALPGDWSGIIIQPGGQAGLSHVSVVYAGMIDSALYNLGQLEVENSLVAYGAHHGVVNGPGGVLTLEDSVVKNHVRAGVKNSGTGFLVRNDIMNNSEYGVYSNTQGYVLVAEHNYWGSVSGPAWDGIQNCNPLPQGGGDKVSCATVDYNPFALAPYH